MVRRIISTGRGGSGKTALIPLATRYLSATDYPSLVIDIDGDQNLADMLGVDLEKEKIRTILDVLFDLLKGKSYEKLKSMPMPQKIKYLFHSDCVYEGKKFDLVSLGVKSSLRDGRLICYLRPFLEVHQKYATDTKAFRRIRH